MSNNNSRRKFIGTTAKGIAALAVGSSLSSSFLASCAAPKTATAIDTINKFTQAPLPYSFDALENVIDARTMEIHYTKHAAGYSKNLIEEIASYKAGELGNVITLPNILKNITKYSTKMRNNAGGHYNHELFWQCMRPKQEGNMPKGKILVAINKTFGSLEEFKKQFTEVGKTRFGSGWAWLYADEKKNLKIGSTANQDNPLMELPMGTVAAEANIVRGFPLLALDVWEHAYYLKYQNKRADYIENWWQVVNWDYVESRFNSLKA
jgi:superoxide dismutase, Fe-Mn family